MIQKESILKVADNSGAKSVRCIGLYKGKTTATIGDIILVSVKTYNTGTDMKKGKKLKALIIRTKNPFNREENGMTIKFNDNAVVIIDDQKKLVGNRVFGSTVREIKKVSVEVTNLILNTY